MRVPFPAKTTNVQCVLILLILCIILRAISHERSLKNLCSFIRSWILVLDFSNGVQSRHLQEASENKHECYFSFVDSTIKYLSVETFRLYNLVCSSQHPDRGGDRQCCERLGFREEREESHSANGHASCSAGHQFSIFDRNS